MGSLEHKFVSRTGKTLRYFSSLIFSRKGPQSSFQRPRWVHPLLISWKERFFVTNLTLSFDRSSRDFKTGLVQVMDTWKVMEFKKFIFQAWKVMQFESHGK